MLKILFYLSLLSLNLGHFAVVGKLANGNLNMYDFVTFLFVFVGTVYFLSKGTLKIPTRLMGYIVFSFLAIVSLYLNFQDLSFSQAIFSSFYLIRFSIYLLYGVVLFNMLRNGILSPEELLVGLVYSALFISIAGFLQLIFLPDFSVLDSSLGFDPHKNRLASTFFDPNFTGGYLALCLAAALDLKFNSKFFYTKKTSLVAFLYIISIAIFLTFSRSSWAAASIIVGVYGIFKSKSLLMVAIVFMFLTYFAVPRVQTRIAGVADSADSAHFRLVSWKNALEISSDHPIFGVGFNSYRYYQKQYGFFEGSSFGGNSGSGSDSSFLLVLATTGILGFLVFVLSYIVPLVKELLKEKKDLLLISASMGLFLHTQFVNSFFFPPILFVFLALLLYRKDIRNSP